ncbi:hypothetical protein [Tabrizicola fusiformis]|uniref:hypothetical protein n=1 Tax=Tabrizicola sp. SY72 TaxID=2741673 RepID=UPI001574D6C5|nr:hypothetical protein [Tabrizicola sp. SY72]NTT85941.1 hypothetical protein [Tabrizicola sp. SY72]
MDQVVSNGHVSKLRTCFFWPLTLDRGPGSGPQAEGSEKFLQAQFKKMVKESGLWNPVEDTLLHLPKSKLPEGEGNPDGSAKERYGEFVYFHDFVQRALFGSTSTPDSQHPLLLLERKDISELTCEFSDFSVALAVERVNLYLLAPGVAVLALQVSVADTVPRLTLARAMAFNERFRRSHIPFFDDDGGAGGGLPRKLVWKLRNGHTQTFVLDEGAADEDPGVVWTKPSDILKQFADAKPGARRVLPLAHWQWLLNGPTEKDDTPTMPLMPDKGSDFHWRHFADDRLPILTTIILPDRLSYYALTDGDWMRLAFVDGPGTDPFAYAEAFLRKSFDDHCYDRYHRKHDASTDAPARYLMCDYALTAVTHQNRYSDVIAMHMQRHYYQMFLLAVVDKATLLSLSSRISRAVEDYDFDRTKGDRKAQAEADLSDRLQNIERDFLHYVHRFRFTGISGQLQAGEMFAQLRSRMALDEIFDDVQNELQTAVAFLSMRESEHATEAGERLNIIASVGLIVALVMGFFSMNILGTADLLLGESAKGGLMCRVLGTGCPSMFLRHLGVFLLGLAFGSFCGLTFLRFRQKSDPGRGVGPRRSETFLEQVFFWALSVFLLAGLVFSWPFG